MKVMVAKTLDIISGLVDKLVDIKEKANTLLSEEDYNSLSNKLTELQQSLNTEYIIVLNWIVISSTGRTYTYSVSANTTIIRNEKNEICQITCQDEHDYLNYSFNAKPGYQASVQVYDQHNNDITDIFYTDGLLNISQAHGYFNLSIRATFVRVA